MSAVAGIEGAITVRQYSERTGLSLMTCYEHVSKGKVPAKPGHKLISVSRLPF